MILWDGNREACEKEGREPSVMSGDNRATFVWNVAESANGCPLKHGQYCRHPLSRGGCVNITDAASCPLQSEYVLVTMPRIACMEDEQMKAGREIAKPTVIRIRHVEPASPEETCPFWNQQVCRHPKYDHCKCVEYPDQGCPLLEAPLMVSMGAHNIHADVTWEKC